MGKVVITEFVSLDGVVEDPGGHEGFRHGGWSFEINRGEDGDRFQLDEALGTEVPQLRDLVHHVAPSLRSSCSSRDPRGSRTHVLGHPVQPVRQLGTPGWPHPGEELVGPPTQQQGQTIIEKALWP
jgi:hypothetical protein